MIGNPIKKIERLEKQIERLIEDKTRLKQQVKDLKEENEMLSKEINITKTECFNKMMLAQEKENEFRKMIDNIKRVQEQYNKLIGLTKSTLAEIKPTYKKVNKEIKKDFK